MRGSTRASVAAESAGMEAGDTLRIVCPECGGGSSGERSMSVTVKDDGAVLFFCYRASCGARGVLGGSPSTISGLVRTSSPKYKSKPDISGRLVDCPDSVNFWPKSFGVKWDPDTGRVALPVYSPTGLVRGWVLRSYDKGVTPKALSWPTVAEQQLGWNLEQGNQVVVVEDVPSAIKLAELGVRAVSLCGTHMTTEAMDELIAEAEDVVWALDGDALAKAQSWDKRTRIHFRNTAVILLQKDFKDQTEEEAYECLREISWLRVSAPEKPMSE